MFGKPEIDPRLLPPSEDGKTRCFLGTYIGFELLSLELDDCIRGCVITQVVDLCQFESVLIAIVVSLSEVESSCDKSTKFGFILAEDVEERGRTRTLEVYFSLKKIDKSDVIAPLYY